MRSTGERQHGRLGDAGQMKKIDVHLITSDGIFGSACGVSIVSGACDASGGALTGGTGGAARGLVLAQVGRVAARGSRPQRRQRQQQQRAQHAAATTVFSPGSDRSRPRAHYFGRARSVRTVDATSAGSRS